MRFPRLRYYLQILPVFILLSSCQKAWYPVAQLPPETDIKLTDAIPQDATAEATIVPYRQQVDDKMNEVIGTATQEMNGRGGGLETTLGNFVADLQREQAAAISGKPVDMGLMTTGGLRAILPQGNIKVGDVFEVMPFENELLVLTLSGATTKKLFAFAAARKIVSLSNATYAIQKDQPVNILVGGKPLDVNRTYTVAISDYLANGGDDMVFLKEATRSDKVGILLRDAIIKQIRQLTAQNKPVDARIEGRVKML
ncbi:MAG: hypothetical protein COW65_15225 [Cytophagales bacterium CG18_big_fil_WC_8_21_14_2_50_42_9]|nr:MAG: hypothetical protein COW65_15225 [Cytophagales bacterium CG18_big_fil_WC_8_21_14_2_50_42_9]